MSELDDKLNAILSNPQMMQQIMNLAQAMGQSDEKNSAEPTQNNSRPQEALHPEGFNPSLLAKFSSLMQRGTIDKNQQSLLRALSPYLSKQKIQKLERAMQAARMAGIASEFAQNRPSRMYQGR